MSSGFGAGPIEAIIIGLLVVAGFSIVGFPLLFLFMNMFNGYNAGTGLNVVPTTTTTVAGRRKREAEAIFGKSNPMIQDKLISILDSFAETPNKFKMIENLLQRFTGSSL